MSFFAAQRSIPSLCVACVEIIFEKAVVSQSVKPWSYLLQFLQYWSVGASGNPARVADIMATLHMETAYSELAVHPTAGIWP